MSVSLGTLSFEKFRKIIEAIENDFHRVLLQTIYLGAFRESEVCAKYERKKILQGLSKPYGNFLKWSIVDYKLDDKRKEKVLLISSAVAKRLKILWRRPPRVQILPPAPEKSEKATKR